MPSARRTSSRRRNTTTQITQAEVMDRIGAVLLQGSEGRQWGNEPMYSGVSWNVILNSVSARADVFAPSPPESSRAAAAAAGVTGTQPGSGEDATGSPQTPSGGGGRGTAQDPPSPHTPQRPSSPSAEDSPHNSPIRRYVDKGKSKAKDVLRQSPVGRFLPRLWQSRTEKKGRKTPSPPHLLDARLRGRLRAIAVIAG
ncbi:hypothetical protein A1Q2_06579 [Trichosporon asahii var. asahii CBS 8904]|uniref:Uncharacterized protein n=1 Tax=Trichosporon asahii var. asahii (strain CBS 8904) TaxID=1220162 RepID=K1VEA5_TRIAC|nr:hypothetical protein A1Q2_06579 [Trichosporon asahii var. asahii CBS 8904]